MSVDWICVCEDLEESSQVYDKQSVVRAVAWAPLMARKAECIAVARGSTVRLLSLGGQVQGHINANENLQAYQVWVTPKLFTPDKEVTGEIPRAQSLHTEHPH